MKIKFALIFLALMLVTQVQSQIECNFNNGGGGYFIFDIPGLSGDGDTFSMGGNDMEEYATD